MSVVANDLTTASRSATVRDARMAGLLYLGLAITGLLGFVVLRSQWVDLGDPAGARDRMVDHEALARLSVALELGIVLTQALAALAFYRLFRSVDAFRAGSLAAFGLVNATVILASAAAVVTALAVAGPSGSAPAGDAAGTVHLLLTLSASLWLVGGLFFGLWLIPMGLLALQSHWMPRALGWILAIGGLGYILSTFVLVLAPDATAVGSLLTIPATVGELWMIGYLLIRGVRRSRPASA